MQPAQKLGNDSTISGREEAESRFVVNDLSRVILVGLNIETPKISRLLARKTANTTNEGI